MQGNAVFPLRWGFSTHLIAYCKGCKLPVEIRRTRSGKLYSVAWKQPLRGLRVALPVKPGFLDGYAFSQPDRVTDAEATEYHRRMTALFKARIRRFSFASTFAARSFCVLEHGSTACAAPCPGSGNRSANMSGPIFFEKISQIGNYPSYLAVRLQPEPREGGDRP